MSESAPTHKSLIPAEVREYFLPTHFDKTTIRLIMPMLPESDAVLDEWLSAMARESEWCGFVLTAMAALAAERPVDSRHLSAAIRFAPSADYLALMAWRMTGDIGANLIAAVQGNMLPEKTVAMSLLVAALWYGKQGIATFPAALIAAVRILVRDVVGREQTLETLHSLAILARIATLSQDESLIAFIKRTAPATADEKIAAFAREYSDTVHTLIQSPLLDLINDRSEAYAPHKGTVRRAVEKHSRNEQCPCGSGKKYKRCCEEKDRERLRHSSSIAGMTREEVHLSPEATLTEKRILATPGLEVSRWDFTKIAPSLHALCLKQLAKYWYVEETATAFEITGYTDEMEDAWKHSAWGCVFLWKRAPLLRLFALREKSNSGPFEFDSGLRILLKGDKPEDFIHELEALAREAIAASEFDILRGIFTVLLHSPLKALGILIARSAIPIFNAEEGTRILDKILKTHDKLSLPPDDPFSDIVEKRLIDESRASGHDSEALRESRRALDKKAAEVRRLKLDLDHTRQEIDKRERKLAARAATATAAPQPHGDDEKLSDLRLKVHQLKSSLKEHNDERTTLRNDLQRVQADLEALRHQSAEKPAAHQDIDTKENAHLSPAEDMGNQPVRLIEFPPRFQHTLDGLPRAIARQAMQTLGRIAAGEPHAFTQIVRLKALPKIFRIRLGIDHRMLFRLQPNAVQAVDIFPRQDLERRIKSLLAAGG